MIATSVIVCEVKHLGFYVSYILVRYEKFDILRTMNGYTYLDVGGKDVRVEPLELKGRYKILQERKV